MEPLANLSNLNEFNQYLNALVPDSQNKNNIKEIFIQITENLEFYSEGLNEKLKMSSPNEIWDCQKSLELLKRLVEKKVKDYPKDYPKEHDGGFFDTISSAFQSVIYNKSVIYNNSDEINEMSKNILIKINDINQLILNKASADIKNSSNPLFKGLITNEKGEKRALPIDPQALARIIYYLPLQEVKNLSEVIDGTKVKESSATSNSWIEQAKKFGFCASNEKEAKDYISSLGNAISLFSFYDRKSGDTLDLRLSLNLESFARLFKSFSEFNAFYNEEVSSIVLKFLNILFDQNDNRGKALYTYLNFKEDEIFKNSRQIYSHNRFEEEDMDAVVHLYKLALEAQNHAMLDVILNYLNFKTSKHVRSKLFIYSIDFHNIDVLTSLINAIPDAQWELFDALINIIKVKGIPREIIKLLIENRLIDVPKAIDYMNQKLKSQDAAEFEEYAMKIYRENNKHLNE